MRALLLVACARVLIAGFSGCCGGAAGLGTSAYYHEEERRPGRGGEALKERARSWAIRRLADW